MKFSMAAQQMQIQLAALWLLALHLKIYPMIIQLFKGKGLIGIGQTKVTQSFEQALV